MTIKDGVLKIKIIVSFSFIISTIISSTIYAQNIDTAPLINLNELEPSYDQEILELDDIGKSNVDSLNKNEKKNIQVPFATISLLNKITTEVKTIDIRLKENYLLDELKIYAIDCHNSKPFEKKETAVYLNVYNQTSMEKIFNGWMLKSLPSVSSMEHPIYDIWVENCYKL